MNRRESTHDRLSVKSHVFMDTVTPIFNNGQSGVDLRRSVSLEL